MNYDEFFEKYKPVKNHIDQNAANDGCMFETYGDELKHVLSIANSPDCRKVWTIMDGDNGSVFIGNGYHLVNRIGYLITEVPAPDGDIEVMVWEDDEANDCKGCCNDDGCSDEEFCKDYGGCADRGCCG